jgi:hypothetical protein
MLIEGSGSGYIPLTGGSGSGRPKKMCWVRWIWIRIRTGFRSLRTESLVVGEPAKSDKQNLADSLEGHDGSQLGHPHSQILRDPDYQGGKEVLSH